MKDQRTFSHLFYTFFVSKSTQLIVKVHRVSSSPARTFASSRRIQFHRVHIGDSRTIVTPFMQDANYAPRNFAHISYIIYYYHIWLSIIVLLNPQLRFFLFWLWCGLYHDRAQIARPLACSL
jgi:hypothetical protein